MLQLLVSLLFVFGLDCVGGWGDKGGLLGGTLDKSLIFFVVEKVEFP